MESILLAIGAAATRKTARPDVGHRASRLTKWPLAERQPEGAGGCVPMPAGFGSTIATAMLFTELLGLDTYPLRQNGSIYLDTALEQTNLATNL